MCCGLAAPLFTIRKTSQAATSPSRMTGMWLIPTSVEPSPAEASLDRPGPAVLQTRGQWVSLSLSPRWWAMHHPYGHGRHTMQSSSLF